MMFLLIFVAIVFSADVTDPLVFDAHFYLGTYGDLLQAKITDKESAEKHWKEHGIREGRYGTSYFHAPSYLKLNPDVEKACKDDYECGVNHYVTIGLTEGRETMIQGVDGLYTMKNNDKSQKIAVYTPRFGSAVHSVIYNNREIVNSWDHGRELQYALTMDGHGECFNPTEAGGGYDLLKTTTHSKLLSISVNSTDNGGEYMETNEYPAFWMAPGSSEKGCGKAVNTDYVSKWQIKKRIDFDIPELPRVSKWTFWTTAPTNITSFQLESPTLYSNGDLPKIYSFDFSTNTLTDITNLAPGEKPFPIIISSDDGSLACGSYASWENTGSNRYAHFNFMFIKPWAASTNKWSMPYRISNIKKGDVINVVSYVTVGSLDQVKNDITSLSKMFPTKED